MQPTKTLSLLLSFLNPDSDFLIQQFFILFSIRKKTIQKISIPHTLIGTPFIMLVYLSFSFIIKIKYSLKHVALLVVL